MVATTGVHAQPGVSRRGFSVPLTSILTYAVLAFGAFFILMPFLYMISTSLNAPSQVFLYPPRWIPSPVVWDN